MSQQASNTASAVPRWLIMVASVAIIFHLSAIVFRSLAATSGPWPMMDSIDMATPPQFAFTADRFTIPYLQAVKMTHNYHFPTNRPSLPAVYLEVRLKDAEGGEMATLKFPDENANPWVRHRQAILARWLGEDRPVMPPMSEVIAAPGRQVPEVTFWQEDENRSLRLEKRAEHLLPRDRPVLQPSEWSLLLARAYARHLCRAHGAASAEVVRHHKNPYPPAVLFIDNFPSGAFDEVASYFGEFQYKDIR